MVTADVDDLILNGNGGGPAARPPLTTTAGTEPGGLNALATVVLVEPILANLDYGPAASGCRHNVTCRYGITAMR